MISAESNGALRTYLLEFRSGDVANQVPGPDVFRLVGLKFDDAGVGALLENFVLEKNKKCQLI